MLRVNGVLVLPITMNLQTDTLAVTAVFTVQFQFNHKSMMIFIANAAEGIPNNSKQFQCHQPERKHNSQLASTAVH